MTIWDGSALLFYTVRSINKIINHQSVPHRNLSEKKHEIYEELIQTISDRKPLIKAQRRMSFRERSHLKYLQSPRNPTLWLFYQVGVKAAQFTPNALAIDQLMDQTLNRNLLFQ